MAPHLSESLLPDALAAVSSRANGYYVQVLTELTAHLPEPLREQALRSALAAALATTSFANDRAAALTTLAPLFPEPWQEQVLRVALAAAFAIPYQERALVLQRDFFGVD